MKEVNLKMLHTDSNNMTSKKGKTMGAIKILVVSRGWGHLADKGLGGSMTSLT